MVKPTSQTPADVALARRASKIAGQEISAGQIRRWRKVGLLPMEKAGLGRGKGFRYWFPEGSAEFAAAIARELPRYGKLELAAKASFAKGVSPAKVEVLIRLLISPIEEAVRTIGEDPHRTATRMADKASRRASRYPLIKDAKGLIGSPSGLSVFLRGGFDFAITGEPAGLAAALGTLNVSAGTSEEIQEAAVKDMGPPGEALNGLSVLIECANNASLDDWERARDDALTMYRASLGAVQAITGLLGIDSDLDPDGDVVEAVDSVPALLVMRQQIGERTDAFLGLVQNPMSFLGQIVEGFKEWSDTNPEDAARLAPLGRAILEGTQNQEDS